MKRAITSSILAISLAAPAFARKPTVTVETDRFTGITTVVLNPTTSLAPRGCRCSVEVSATADGKNADASIFFRMTVMAENWMYLNGIDVPVLIDGQPMTLSFRKGATAVGRDAWTYETLLAEIDKATLDRIANAEKFEMELQGMGFSFNAKSIGYFKEFDNAVDCGR